MNCFETGPIRPPSEAGSVLLRLTRNCHWNRCAFCPVYKGQRFSVRKVDEVKRDIDAMAAIAETIRGPSGGAGGRGPIIEAVRGLDGPGHADRECVRQVGFWLSRGMRSLFLQDADALVWRTHDLIDVLRHARAAFPTIERITTYARAKTVARKSPEELVALRAAGLNRVHIGMESGSDAVLSLVCKGVTREEQILAGRRVMAAGIELSEYFMPGLGGRALSAEHALESAAVLNAVDPTFIRLRSAVPIPRTPLHQMMAEGRWVPLTEEEKVREIRAFVGSLDGISSTVQSDHIMNLLEGVAGRLPGDKAVILERIDRFLDMDPRDREAFIVGRRTGWYRDVSDYAPAPEVEAIRRDLVCRFGSVERGILEVLASFV